MGKAMGRRHARLSLLAAAMMAALNAAPTAAREFAYIESPHDGEILVIDLASLALTQRINVIDHTDDVIGSPDGRFAYANAAISSNALVPAPAEGGKVMGIDTATNKIIWSTFLDGQPQHLTVSLDGKRLFAPVLNRSVINVIDTASGRIVDRWASTVGNHGTILSPDGKRLYVGNVYPNSLYVYDTETGQLIKRFKTRDQVRPLAVSPDGREVYYQLSNFHGFEIRDTDNGTLIDTINLPALPKGVSIEDAVAGTTGHGMEITPDGSKLLVVATIANYLAIYDRASRKLLGTVPIGKDGNWVRVTADSRRALVTNRGDGTVSVIDLQTMKEIKRVNTAKGAARFDIIDVPGA